MGAALAVPQVVALIHNDEAIRRQRTGGVVGEPGDAHHAVAAEAVGAGVVLPHRHEVLGAEDERLKIQVVLHHAGQRGGHQRLAQPDHIADDHAPLTMQLPCGNLHRPLLKLEQHTLKLRRDPYIADTGLRLARQLIRELQIDLIRRRPRLARPALVDQLRQLTADVETEAVAPVPLEPCPERIARRAVDQLDVELALPREPGEGEVAAAQDGGGRRVRIAAVEEVELGVQRVAEEQPDRHLPATQL